MNDDRIVLLGDVGGSTGGGGYHVGDEAMLEAALAELRDRGFGRFTVLSADPIDTAGRYGVQSIPQFGFGGLVTESDRDARLKELLADPAHPWAFTADDPALRIRDALIASTAAVVTGGGNLDATWPHHVYERAALVGMARALGRQIVVTGQGIGPNLDRRCGELVASIINDADLISVRDRESLDLVGQLGQDSRRVTVRADDAISLAGTARPDLLADRGLTPGGFIAGTFSEHSGMLDPTEYLYQLAHWIDAVADVTGLPMLLVPHHGTADSGDVALHAQLAGLTRADLLELPVLDARDAVWVTGQAALVAANRYHPVVFALAAGVPAIGVAVDEYTHRKISGALAWMGLADFCLPAVALADDELAGLAVAECWARRDEITAHLLAQRPLIEAASAGHWDRVAGLLTGAPVETPLPPTESVPLTSSGGWAARAAEMHRWADRLARRDAARRREFDDACARIAGRDAAIRLGAEQRAAALDRIALLERVIDLEQDGAASARALAGEALDRVDELSRQQQVLAHQLESTRGELAHRSWEFERLDQDTSGLRQQLAETLRAAAELHALQQTKLLRWSSGPRRGYESMRRGMRRD